MARFAQKSAAFLLLFLLVLTVAAPQAVAGKKPWEKFKYPELGKIEMPAYQRQELPNGLVIYLAEDHEFPLVELSATIRAGGIYDPPEKIGLGRITGTVLRTGGTEKMTGDEIDELVEAKGMNLETWVSNTSGGAYLSALKEDVDSGLSLLADILRRPRFAPDKIELAKKEQNAAISRRNDDPMTIARREATKAIFGADHPLARHPEYDTINAITRQDLFDFHGRFFQPNYTYLVVIGDFDSQQMLGLIEQEFGDWPRTDAELPPDPEIPDLPRTVNVVDKEDLTQSTVVLGHKGIRADDENYAAIEVANRILGGGFASRLFREVRSNRGYAYAVGSTPGTGFRFPGVFLAFCGTKSATTQAATEAVLEQIKRMTTELVTDKELAVAKDGILNSEVFNFDTKREVLDRLVTYEMFGYPPDFLQEYQDAVRNMTPQKVLAAAQAVWHPDRMTLFAVGKRSDWDGDLSEFGPVNEIDITIPEPSLHLEIPAATPEALQQGQEWMARAADAVGGANWSRLKAYREKVNLAAKIMGMDMTIDVEKTTQLPDRQHTVQSFMGMQITSCIAGDQGWIKAPPQMGGDKDMNAEQVARGKEEIDTDTLVLFGHHQDFPCQALKPTALEGRQCLPVYITGLADPDDYILLFLDAQSFLPYVTQSKGQQPGTGAPVTQKVIVNEFQEVQGFHVPKTFTITHDDEEFGTGTVLEFEINPSVPSGLFQK